MRGAGAVAAGTIGAVCREAASGWGSGAIFDISQSYTLAFVHGIGWNLVNVWVTVFLLSRARHRGQRTENGGAMATA